MTLLKGVYQATKKNGTIYYRASITYKSKHISLGSYDTETVAHDAYQEAYDLLNGSMPIPSYGLDSLLSFEKWVILINYRDNGHYIKNPIYLHKYYFSYYLNQTTELIFDVDDLFYYSHHKIFRKNGYLFVNDYGMQVNILSRYGIKNFAVKGKDYYFKDGDASNFRYHNIHVVNPYYGVEKIEKNARPAYIAKINLRGYYKIGTYTSDTEAAIAYNKAVDFVLNHGITTKNFTKNYLTELNTAQYLALYQNISISPHILSLKKNVI
ncbi:hypothetical protein HZI73_11335 [Vallitalea pronyensis]|uniref:AP2/ERF domain-containing protein n=1 Tax=Vallitalea pronyensis TaxID=1348613 RepID=A0A8J8MK02_9FIRM|nr:hypothetical protein [Vallitalea pronyensis]QUI22846.1 hypothetical protein HZI73_11335 [Vallitalea pronyensis]